MPETRQKSNLIGRLCWLLVGFVSVNAAIILSQKEYRENAAFVLEDWSSSELAPGFSLRRYRDDRGTHRYTVFVPEIVDGGDKALPVILFLNGFGENGDDGIHPLLNGLASRIRQTQGTFPFLAVFMQCHKHEESWAAGGTAINRVEGILNQLRSQLTLDEKRIHLTGLSSGAQGAWHFGWSEQIDFASVFPVASTAPGIQGRTREGGPATAMFFNRFDTTSVREKHEEVLSHLLDHGTDAIVVDTASNDVAHDGHNSWDSTFRSGSTYAWLARQSVDERVNFTLLPEFETREDSKGVPLGACSGDFELVFEVRPVDGTSVCLSAVDATEGKRQWKLRVNRPQDGPSDIQFSGNEHRNPCSIVAALSLRPKEWNTFRLNRRGEEVQIFLNEWLLTRQTASGNSWNFFLQNSGQFEVRNARGHGVDHIASTQPDGFVEAAARPCDFSAQQVIDSWAKNGVSDVNRSFSWKLNRQHDGQWSTFHAASLHQESQAFDIHMKGEETEIRRPWNYLSAGFGVDGFERGVSRVNHQRWMAAFKDQRSSQICASRSQITLSNSMRSETVTFEDPDVPSRTIITNDSDASLGSDMPDDLFCRVPQLIYEPFAEHSFGIAEESLVMEPEMCWANGHLCCVLQWRDPESESSLRTFHSPDTGFCPVKGVATHEDGTVDVVKIDYGKTEPGSIEVSGWAFACTRAQDPFAEKRYPGCRNVIHYGIASDVRFGESRRMATKEKEQIVCNRISGQWIRVTADGSEHQISDDELLDIQNRDSGIHRAAPVLNTQQGVVIFIILALLFVLFRRIKARTGVENQPSQQAEVPH